MVDLAKSKAIIDMLPPRTEKEIRGFLGKIQYISHFIAQLTPICKLIYSSYCIKICPRYGTKSAKKLSTRSNPIC